jgi:hypothetical protein
MKSIFEHFPIIDGKYEDAVKYVSALLHFAHLDGLHIEEEKAILNFIQLHGWSPDIYRDAKNTPIHMLEDLNLSEEAVEIFAAFLLRDAIGICHVHDGYSNDEKNAIKRLASELNIDENKLATIEKAVALQIDAITHWSSI